MISFEGTPQIQTRELISQQKDSSKKNNSSINLTLVSFDDTSTRWINNLDVNNIQDPTDTDLMNWLEPRGTTRLIDTILEELTKQEKRVEEYSKNLPRMVRDLNPTISSVMQILTDGADNRSINGDEVLKRAIISAQKKGVVIIFIAANQDAIRTAHRFGINENTSLTIGNDPETSLCGLRGANELMRSVSDGYQNQTFSMNVRQSSQPLNTIESYSDSDSDYGSDDDSPPPTIAMTGHCNYVSPLRSTFSNNHQLKLPPPPSPMSRSVRDMLNY